MSHSVHSTPTVVKNWVTLHRFLWELVRVPETIKNASYGFTAIQIDSSAVRNQRKHTHQSGHLLHIILSTETNSIDHAVQNTADSRKQLFLNHNCYEIL